MVLNYIISIENVGYGTYNTYKVTRGCITENQR